MKHIQICVWALVLMTVFVLTGDLFSDDLSDARKKEIVDQLYNGYKKELPTVKDIQPTEAIQLLRLDKIVLVDVRTPAEMNISMLPGAITKDDYLKGLDSYRGLTAVAYCTIGYRSGTFAEKMAARGIEIKNLAGGLLAWVHDGGQVYRDGKEVKQIHVYGPKWDYPPSGYNTVMFGLFGLLKVID